MDGQTDRYHEAFILFHRTMRSVWEGRKESLRKLSHQKSIRNKQNNCKTNWHSEKWPVCLYLDEFFSSPNIRGQSQVCHVDEGDTSVYLYKRRDKPKEKGKLDTPAFGTAHI